MVDVRARSIIWIIGAPVAFYRLPPLTTWPSASKTRGRRDHARGCWETPRACASTLYGQRRRLERPAGALRTVAGAKVIHLRSRQLKIAGRRRPKAPHGISTRLRRNGRGHPFAP